MQTLIDRRPQELTLITVVDRVERVTDSVVVLELTDAHGRELRAWEPGAHIDLLLQDDLVRQYSLCGDPADRSTYRIAVLRETDGRGGSAFVHDHLRQGQQVRVRGPRNTFPLHDAQRQLFIAGGIGITPLLPMIRRADSRGADWRLTYGGKTRESMAFLDELNAYGGRVDIRPQDKHGLLDVQDILQDVEAGAHVYCCGPGPLIDAVELACREGSTVLHVERFQPRPSTSNAAAAAFEVVCARSGTTVVVGPDTSILAALTEAGVEPLSSCAEGTCGSCETRVLEGRPDHRDSVLTEDERAAGETMMVCVSRCLGSRLVLDL